MSLKIGRIAYLNVAPYFHHLRTAGFTGDILSGVPSELNRMLSAGAIDVCPSSSFEYGLHAADYLLLPGHSISSVGPVHSVLFFHHEEERAMGEGPIAITGESATSINLLKVLMYEFCGATELSCEVPQGEVEDSLAAGRDALLIGDRALRAAKRFRGKVQILDLGALWYHFTGLPFVFALWILRRDVLDDKQEELVQFAAALNKSRQMAFADLMAVAKASANDAVLGQDELVRYWEGMSYELTEGHLEGLRLYFTLCQKYGLLDAVPEFNFLKMDDG